MRTTIKLRNFCAEPMVNKPIEDVPGVGVVVARKFRKNRLRLASDLYDKLDKFNYDEQRFKTWITNNYTDAGRAKIIHEALMQYHLQYSDILGERSILGQGRNNNRGVQDIISSDDEDIISDNPTPSTSQIANSNNSSGNADPISLFFASFSDLGRRISPEFHTAFKVEILGTINKYERRSHE